MFRWSNMILYDLFIFRQSILLHDSGRYIYIYIGIDPHDPLYIYIFIYIIIYIPKKRLGWSQKRNPGTQQKDSEVGKSLVNPPKNGEDYLCSIFLGDEVRSPIHSNPPWRSVGVDYPHFCGLFKGQPTRYELQNHT